MCGAEHQGEDRPVVEEFSAGREYCVNLGFGDKPESAYIEENLYTRARTAAGRECWLRRDIQEIVYAVYFESARFDATSQRLIEEALADIAVVAQNQRHRKCNVAELVLRRNKS
jgi:hypothetical protein